MKNLRKSLAVLLAVIMLATFMPLFASAATVAASKANCVIVEYPQFSYTDPKTNLTVTTDATNTNLTVPYGTTYDEINLVGGKITYNDTVVEGYFDWQSTYLTRTPDVGVQTSYRLYFYPTDTTAYSRGTWRMSDITGWPTITVNGLDATLIEAPTTTEILTGQMLREATLSGGIVNGVDGNPLTGYWEYVYPASYPTESGKYEVQFTATGYNALKTTVDVKVTSNGNATIAEAPVIQYYMAVNDWLIDSKLTGGKVVDENGNEITTGKWIFPDIESQKSSEIVFDKEGIFTYKAQWSALGYPVLFADVTVTVDAGYTVDKPTLTSPVYYVPTKGELPFVYGNASVLGSYAVENPDEAVGTNKNTNQTVKLTFTPENSNYKPTTWSYTFKIQNNNIWYTQPEEPVTIIVPYGHSGNTATKGTVLSWPEYLVEQGVADFWWNRNDYAISSLEIGEKILVTGFMRKGGILGYDNVSASAYIQAESTTIEGDFGYFTTGRTDKYTGEIGTKFYCNIPGITGTVTIKLGDKVLATFTPDANGKIDENIRFTPGKDGTYVLTATYTPAETDKVTVLNTEVQSEEIVLETLKQYKLTVYVANQKFEYDVYETNTVYHSWADFSSDPHADVFDHWVVTDGNGNEVTVENFDVTYPHLRFTMPEHDLVLTAKGEIEDMTVSDGSLSSSLLSFWQKLINFIIEIYRTIADLFNL